MVLQNKPHVYPYVNHILMQKVLLYVISARTIMTVETSMNKYDP